MDIFAQVNPQAFTPENFDLVYKNLNHEWSWHRRHALEALTVFVRVNSSYATSESLSKVLGFISFSEEEMQEAARDSWLDIKVALSTLSALIRANFELATSGTLSKVLELRWKEDEPSPTGPQNFRNSVLEVLAGYGTVNPKAIKPEHWTIVEKYLDHPWVWIRHDALKAVEILIKATPEHITTRLLSKLVGLLASESGHVIDSEYILPTLVRTLRQCIQAKPEYSRKISIELIERLPQVEKWWQDKTEEWHAQQRQFKDSAKRLKKELECLSEHDRPLSTEAAVSIVPEIADKLARQMRENSAIVEEDQALPLKGDLLPSSEQEKDSEPIPLEIKPVQETPGYQMPEIPDTAIEEFVKEPQQTQEVPPHRSLLTLRPEVQRAIAEVVEGSEGKDVKLDGLSKAMDEKLARNEAANGAAKESVFDVDDDGKIEMEGASLGSERQISVGRSFPRALDGVIPVAIKCADFLVAPGDEMFLEQILGEEKRAYQSKRTRDPSYLKMLLSFRERSMIRQSA